jgi:hypothetical protein
LKNNDKEKRKNEKQSFSKTLRSKNEKISDCTSGNLNNLSLPWTKSRWQ